MPYTFLDDVTQDESPRYGECRFGGVTHASPVEALNSPAPAMPVRLNTIRADGLVGTAPPATPGESGSVTLRFLPCPGAPSMRSRYDAARRYLRRSGSIETVPTKTPECYYVEYHGRAGGTQLVEFAPLAVDASGMPGDQATRDSTIEPRWAVVTGGSETVAPADIPGNVTVYQLQLELTTIAPSRQFDDEADPRQAVRDAYERNGL